MIYKGLIINIYGNDHNPPHIHVSFAEYKAVINILTAEIIEGSLPKSKKKIAVEFVQSNEYYLLEKFYERNSNLRK